MGLNINIYKCNKYGDCTNNGVSSWNIKIMCFTFITRVRILTLVLKLNLSFWSG